MCSVKCLGQREHRFKMVITQTLETASAGQRVLSVLRSGHADEVWKFASWAVGPRG